MIANIINPLTSLGGPLAYLLLGALAFGEAAAFLGVVLPGETALLLGGYLAYLGRVSLPIMIAVAVVAAVAGDSVGYEVGRHLGPRLRASRAGRFVGARRWDRGESFVRRLGGRAVFAGRFVGLLRALVPTVAGMSRIPYRVFLAYNAAGALVWGTACVVGGYLAGSSLHLLERYLRLGGPAVLGLIAVVVLSVYLVRRYLRRRRAAGQGDLADAVSQPTLARPPDDPR